MVHCDILITWYIAIFRSYERVLFMCTLVLTRPSIVFQMPQVLLSAAVGTVSTQKDVIDLWWNTTFLAEDGKPSVAWPSLQQ